MRFSEQNLLKIIIQGLPQPHYHIVTEVVIVAVKLHSNCQNAAIIYSLTGE